tara:strand:+ start:1789 stop:2175 length:387 start_codon:yes stop_codon:yes gene_type:complete
MNKSSIYSLLVLLIYCVALAPSFIPHSHENSNHTNCKFSKHSQCDSHKHEKTKCEEKNCSHDSHLETIKRICLLCEIPPVYNHLYFELKINFKKPSFLEKHQSAQKSYFYKKFTNLSNKSPPTKLVIV